MSVNACTSPLRLGYAAAAALTAATTQLNAAPSSKLLAIGFIPTASKTVNKVRVFVSAVTTGGNAPSALQADVYSDTGGSTGQPNASLGSTQTITGGIPSAAGWIEFTGLSVAVTAGTQYWSVLSNQDASPATKNVTYRYCTGAIGAPLAGASSAPFNGPVALTYNGTTWSLVGVGAAMPRIGYSDGSYDGLPFSNTGAGTNKAFGTTSGGSSNQVGVRFTTPSNATLNALGVAMQVCKIGSPTGFPVFQLYNNAGTLLAATPSITVGTPTTSTSNSDWLYGQFSTLPAGIAGGTSLNVMLADSAADSSANCYRLNNEITFDTDGNSTPLLPFNGTLIEVTTANGGSSFGTVSGVLMPFELTLQFGNEFAAQASGGRANMIGM